MLFMVRSAMYYGAEFRGFDKGVNLERMQLGFLRVCSALIIGFSAERGYRVQMYETERVY